MISEYALPASIGCVLTGHAHGRTCSLHGLQNSFKNYKILQIANTSAVDTEQSLVTIHRLQSQWTICIALALLSINAELVYTPPLPQNVTIIIPQGL